MEKAQVLFIRYEKSDTLEKQGKRKDIEKYLKDYNIKENRNGYWVLTKPSRLIVTLSNSYGKQTFNMKQAVLNHYGRERISESLVDTFEKDIAHGKISLYMDSNYNYSLL